MLTIPDWRLPRGVSRALWEYTADPRIAREDEAHLAGSPLMRFDQQLLDHWFRTPGPLVDLGCGTGRTLVAFADRGFPVVGVDLSPEALRVARDRAAEHGHHVPVLRANLCELECLSLGQFDYALLMFGTLGMVSGSDNRRAVLTHARRVLKPGGQLALHVHNLWAHLRNPQGRRWLLRDLAARLGRRSTAGDTRHDYRGIPNMYHHVFRRREILQLLRACGLTPREIVPVAPSADHSELRHPHLLPNLRAGGWIIRAEATGEAESLGGTRASSR